MGPLLGKVVGRPKDLAWQEMSLLISPELRSYLVERRVRLPRSCSARLKYRGGELRFEEPQIEPTLEISKVTPKSPPPCSECGLVFNWYPKRFVVDRSSVRARMDLFRLKDCPAIVLGTERFVEAIEARGIAIRGPRVAVK
jgi:hypothetical protein